MEIKTKIITKPIINFIFGLPDNKKILVEGFNKKRELNYSWSGNTQLHNIINDDNFIKNYTTIIWHSDPKREIRVPDLLVNCISDADICSKSLKRAIEITEGIKTQFPQTYIYNDPKKVLKTTRDSIYNNFHNLENIIIPKVIRITPASAEEVFEISKKIILIFLLLFALAALTKVKDCN
jgi:hypothetical protein